MPQNNFGRLSRVLRCVFFFSFVLNLAHADTIIWDSFRGGKGLFSDDSGQVCVGLDQSTRGVCMTRRNCGNQGGKVVGYCGVSSTCCSLTTCGYSISSKEAILNMPNVGKNFPGLECSYNIVPHNRRVTQIRIDLEILTLSQPTTDNNDWNGIGDENWGGNGGWNDNGRSGGNQQGNGNGGWNNGNNNNNNSGSDDYGSWNNVGNDGNGNNDNGEWNYNGSNGGSNIGGNSNGGWNRNDNINGGSGWNNGNNKTPTTSSTNSTSSSSSITSQSGTVNDFRSNSGDHQRYRRAVEDVEIKSDYDEETFFRNGGLEDLVQTDADDGWNDDVVNSEDFIVWNGDRFRTTSTTTTSTTTTTTAAPTTTTTTTTTAPSTTRTTTHRPNPDNNGNHGNNGGGWGNGHGNENDQPQEYKCQHDVFEVTNYVDSRSIIPHLCGENSGQHFYISLDSFKNSGIRITLKIADRQHNDNLAIPNWRIRIRQIEDRGKRNAKDLDDSNRQDETINTGVGGLFAAVSGRTHTPDVGELLAPAGCLQYYPERTGTIESFNYNSGKGPYLPKLRYAICFKRTSSVCGVKLMARKFQLSSLRNNNNQVDSDCEGPGRDIRRGDYLLIPDGVSKKGLRGTKWCGNSAQHSVVAFTSPGPLYVFFNSDKYITRREIGFKMSFAVLNNC